MQTHIVKRKAGVSEPFDERKLYASVYAICLSVRIQQAEAEQIAGRICQEIEPWLKNKQEVTSNDIRHQAAKLLTRYNSDAAYLYQHHHKVG